MPLGSKRKGKFKPWTKVMGVSVICSTLLIFLTFSKEGTAVVEEVRWWASRPTEYVVAGWQADRFDSSIRDLEARLDRLNTKKKLNKGVLTVEDQADFDRWSSDLRAKKNLLKVLESTQRPVVEQQMK